MCADDSQKAFGLRLGQLRKAAGFTQASLAEHAEISCVYVNKLERGLASPSIQVLQRLAQCLEADMATLLSSEEPAAHQKDNGGRTSPYLTLFRSGVSAQTRGLIFETMETPMPTPDDKPEKPEKPD